MKYSIHWNSGRIEEVSGDSFIQAFFAAEWNVSHLGSVKLVVKNPNSLPQMVLQVDELTRMFWELLAIEFIKDAPQLYNPVLGNGFDRTHVTYFLETNMHKF